jgi:hypothetical protein
MANRSGSVIGGVGVGDGVGVSDGVGVGDDVGVGGAVSEGAVVVVVLLSEGAEQAAANSASINKRPMTRTKRLPKRVKTSRERRETGSEGCITLTSGKEDDVHYITASIRNGPFIGGTKSML